MEQIRPQTLEKRGWVASCGTLYGTLMGDLMDEATLDTAIAEADRFLSRANDLRAARRADDVRVERAKANGERAYRDDLPVPTAAVRRASMDLTRALANLRRPRH